MPSLKDQDPTESQPGRFLALELRDPRWKLAQEPFDEHYDPLVLVPYWLRDEQPKIQGIGARDNKKCALCDRTEAETPFKQVSHLIPEALGNRHYVSHEECDECNGTYGRLYENELGRMLQVERAVQRVRAKDGGTAIVRSSTGTSYVGGGSFNAPLRIHFDKQDPFLRFDYVDGGAILTVKAPPFRPMQALRSILKSAWLAFKPQTRQQYGFLKRFIKNEICFSPSEFFQYFLFEGWDAVFLEAWQRKAASLLPTAELVVRLTFGHFVLVWCSPETSTLQHCPSLLPPSVVSLTALMQGAKADLETTVSKGRQIDLRLYTFDDPDNEVSSRDVTYSITYAERTTSIGEEATTPSATLIKLPEKKHRERPIYKVKAELINEEESACIDETYLTLFRTDERNDRYQLQGGTAAATITLHEDRKKGTTRLDIKKQLHLSNAADGYKTMRFLRILFEKPSTFRVTDLETGIIIRDFPFTEMNSKDNYRAYEDFLAFLVKINTKFGLDLRIPDPPYQLPLPLVAWISLGMEHGTIERIGREKPIAYPALVKAEQAKVILGYIQAGDDLTFEEPNYMVDLLGTTINLGKISHTLKNPRLDSSVAELESAVARMSGEETIEIRILCDSIVDDFPR